LREVGEERGKPQPSDTTGRKKLRVRRSSTETGKNRSDCWRGKGRKRRKKQRLATTAKSAPRRKKKNYDDGRMLSPPEMAVAEKGSLGSCREEGNRLDLERLDRTMKKKSHFQAETMTPKEHHIA